MNSKYSSTSKLALLIVAVTTLAIGFVAYPSTNSDSSVNTVRSLRADDLSASKFLDIEITRKLDDDTGSNVDASTFTIPTTSLKKSFLVHSVYNKGTSRDGKLVGDTYAAFAQTSEHIVFHFELSENKKDMYVVREDYNTRTTDEQMKYTKDRSVWPGYVATIPILSSTADSYVISVRKLVEQGFFVHQQLVSEEYTIIEKDSTAHKINTNLVVEYFLPQYQTAFSFFFSIVKLPETPMTARVGDNRIGYFSSRYTDLGTNKRSTSRESDDVDRSVTIIHRQRLEKDEAGNVKNQIKYYIDPSVPQRWRQAFREGVEFWAPAFEKAGFKNAIRAILPGDADWPADYHVGDLRYNSISLVVSERVVAIGPSVVDPRSGEIIHCDITFGHGWLKSWYKGFEKYSPKTPTTKDSKKNIRGSGFQCHKADDIGAEAEKADVLRAFAGDEYGHIPQHIIQAAYRETVMHEVGHTLGLRHNFYASIERTPEQLRNNDYVKKHGTGSSIMDYIGSNVWTSIVNDNPNTHAYFQEVVGEYDVAAINYGYRQIKGEVSTYANEELAKIASTAPIFATDEDLDSDLNGQNPYVAQYDYSSDPIFYIQDQLALQKILRKNIVERSILHGESWTKLYDLEGRFISRVARHASSLSQFVGGINITHVHYSSGQKNLNIPLVSRKDQLRAIGTIVDIIEAGNNLFPHPDKFDQYVQEVGYECKDSVTSYCLSVKVADVDGQIQKVRQSAVASILSVVTFNRLILQGVRATVSLEEVITSIVKAVFTESVYSHDINVKNYAISLLRKLSRNSDSRIAAAATNGLKLVTKLQQGGHSAC